MADLINRADALTEVEIIADGYWHHEVIRKAHKLLTQNIKAIPAVDAVEVVRCYKCKQSERMANPYGTVLHCHVWNKTVDYDGFCHEGY